MRSLLEDYHVLTTSSAALDLTCTASSLLKIFRIKTLLKYLSQFAQLKGFEGHGLRVLKACVIVIIYVHWMACMHYFIPCMVYYHTSPERISDDSWIKVNKMYSASVWYQYASCLLRVISNMCNMNLPTVPIAIEDVILNCINLISGFMVIAYLVVVMLQWLQSRDAAVIKYMILMNQIEYYIIYRQLPKNLQQRLLAYYEHGYHRRYFKEQAISDLLSDILREEIRLHMCRKLIKNVLIFRGQPQSVINNIIKYLKLKIYLTNDDIIKAGTPGDCMYFVSTGTVALLTPAGRELGHMEDGAFFGEVTLITEENLHTACLVAASICELYRLDKVDFAVCIQPYESLYERIKTIAYDRKAQITTIN
ncbi:hypothetical protein L9F63_024413 [Diploptera punctata]|uniref:Cyclic nucleotide-binding domain-containing protein n=1 Tax=Diploptera punctata TaxID=6984 RepID=A0AAD7ZFM1_DIPPU|nr:hypothetical protein L9F63_024413 [Diploptera punctata]